MQRATMPKTNSVYYKVSLWHRQIKCLQFAYMIIAQIAATLPHNKHGYKDWLTNKHWEQSMMNLAVTIKL